MCESLRSVGEHTGDWESVTVCVSVCEHTGNL